MGIPFLCGWARFADVDCELPSRWTETCAYGGSKDHMQKIAVAMLQMLFFAAASSHAEVSCPLDAFSKVAFPAPVPIGVDEFKFTIDQESSRVGVRVTNRDPRPINALFMVVDFYESGRYLLSVTFYSATSVEEPSFKPAAHLWPASTSPAPLDSSLLTGQSYRESEGSAIRPINCPDEARLTVLQIAFADGVVFDHRVSGWRVDPSLLFVEPLTLNGYPAKPISLSGRISVNEHGQARVIEMNVIDSDGSEESEVTDWVMEKIKGNFNYAPGLYDGLPISCEMNVLIRFYPTEGSDPLAGVPRYWAGPATTVIDLVSRAPGKTYELVYGEYPFIGEDHQPKLK